MKIAEYDRQTNLDLKKRTKIQEPTDLKERSFQIENFMIKQGLENSKLDYQQNINLVKK